VKELFIENSLDFYIRFLKVNKKKFWAYRIFLGLAIFLILALVFLKTQNVFVILLAPMLAYIGYKLPYIQMVSRKNMVDMVNSFLFPEFLRTFISLLGTQGNVFQTLTATIPYIEEPLKSEVEKLVAAIEKDNDRKHYLALAEYIDSNEAYLIMSMIYEFSLIGTNKEMLDELERYVEDIQNNKTQELKRFKIYRMEKNANIPLVTTIVFVLIFTLSSMFYYANTLSQNL